MGVGVQPEEGSGNTPDKAPRAADLFGPTLVRGDEPPLASPSQHLQMALEAEFTPPPLEKWPPIKTVAFIVVVCGGFWALVALAVLYAL
jgi:hypothetical protein